MPSQPASSVSPSVLTAPLPAHWRGLQRTKNTAIYYGIRVSFAVLRRIPLGILRPWARFLGTIAYFSAVRERKRALKHLAMAYPEKSTETHEQIARDMFKHLALSAFEALHMHQLSHVVTLSAKSRTTLDDALADPQCQGVIAVSGHIGNWEFLAQTIAQSGYDVSSIAKALYDPRLTRLSHEVRTRDGLKIIYRGDRSAARHMMRVLRRNAILGLLIDQDTKVQGVFAPFFGKPAYTPSAAAQLALRMNTRLVVAWHRRQATEHEFTVEPVHISAALREAGALKNGPEFDGAVLELTCILNEKLEAAINQAPEQWVWLHRRWRTTAENQ